MTVQIGGAGVRLPRTETGRELLDKIGSHEGWSVMPGGSVIVSAQGPYINPDAVIADLVAIEDEAAASAAPDWSQTVDRTGLEDRYLCPHDLDLRLHARCYLCEPEVKETP